MTLILRNVYLKHAKKQMLYFLFYFMIFMWYGFQAENEGRFQPCVILADNIPELSATHLKWKKKHSPVTDNNY